MDPTVVIPPSLVPWLALLPVVQVAAGALANVPRLWGVTHETVWSRIFRTVASLPVIYRPGAGAPVLKVPGPSGRVSWPMVIVLFLAAGLFVRCAGFGKALQTVEASPVKQLCVAFDPPVYDSTRTKVCDAACFATDPPSATWSCKAVTP